MKRIPNVSKILACGLYLLIGLVIVDPCLGGIPAEYYTTGFFDKPYPPEEMVTAPPHDINNNLIHTSFFVDDPQNPQQFFGIYSCGHAPEEICRRVSQLEIQFILRILNRYVGDFHIGFGITYVNSKEHLSEALKLWQWYKDIETRDTLFSKHVKPPTLYSEDQRRRVLDEINTWQVLLSRENVFVRIENECPLPYKVTNFSMPHKLDISHLILNDEEILILEEYIHEVIDQIYDRLINVIHSVNIQEEIEEIKREEARLKKVFIGDRSIDKNARLAQVIDKMVVNYNMIEGWLSIQNSNRLRSELNFSSSTELIALLSLFPKQIKALNSLTELLKKTPLLVPLQGQFPQGRTGYRQTLIDGMNDYENLKLKVKETAQELEPLQNNFNKFSELYHATYKARKMLDNHADYLDRMKKMLKMVYSNERIRAKLEEETLNAQELIWLNTIFSSSLDFLKGYSNAASYLSFFSEKNTTITIPLFLDAMSRGWPGDHLLATDKSQNIFDTVKIALIDQFGEDVFHLLVHQPNTYFKYSDDGINGALIQSISGDIILAGIPVKVKGKPAANLPFVIDPWNYRQIFTNTRGGKVDNEILLPELKQADPRRDNKGLEPSAITQVDKFEKDMKTLFRGSWPVFMIHNGVLEIFYGRFTKPVHTATFSGYPYQLVDIIVKYKEEFQAANQLVGIFNDRRRGQGSDKDYIGRTFGQYTLKSIHESYTALQAFQVEGQDGKSYIKIRPVDSETSTQSIENEVRIADYFRKSGISIPEYLDMAFNNKVLEVDDVIITRETSAPGMQMSEKADRGKLTREDVLAYRKTVFKMFQLGKNIPTEFLNKPAVDTNKKMLDRLLSRNQRSHNFFQVFNQVPGQRRKIFSSSQTRKAAQNFHHYFENVIRTFFEHSPLTSTGYVHDCIYRNYFIDENNQVTTIDVGGNDYLGHLGNVLSVMIKEAKPEDYNAFKATFVELMENYEGQAGKKIESDLYVEVLKCMIKSPYEHSSSDSKMIFKELKKLYGVSSDESLIDAMQNPKRVGELEKILDKWEAPYLRNMRQILWTLKLLGEYQPDLLEAITPLIQSLEKIIKKKVRVTRIQPCRLSG